jgi:hypothetical protein
MINKNKNAIRKVGLIHCSHFTPVGIYSKLCKKQRHKFIPTKVTKQKQFFPNTIIQSCLFLMKLVRIQ